MSRQNIFDNVTPDNLLRTKLGELLTNVNNSTSSRAFFFAEVISVNDNTNTNRLKVRIPVIDDIFYLDKNGDMQEGIGDDNLPWCISANSRFLSTPEEGSIVLVALIEPKTPYFGRIWFSAISEETKSVLFSPDTLKEELFGENNWKNTETVSDLAMSATPGERGRKKSVPRNGKIVYPTGIKGKDKNKLVFDKGKTTLVQNEKEKGESKLELTGDALLTAKKLNLLSSNSNRREQPPFADPLFAFLGEMLAFDNAIVQLLATCPGIGNLAFNVAPSPQAPQLVAQGRQLQVKLEKLKQTGKSKDITIN